MKDELKEIIARIRPIFLRYGIKSVTMGDIARELGISKKTLYKYFENKQDLVSKVVTQYCTEKQEKMCVCISESENAIDEIIRISNNAGEELKRINPSVHFELSKYYREAWDTFNEYHRNYIETCVINNLKRGIKEGLYRKNLNVRIIARIYISRIDTVFNPLVYPPEEFNFFEVHLEMIRYHIRGIASEEGIKYLSQRIKQEQTKY